MRESNMLIALAGILLHRMVFALILLTISQSSADAQTPPQPSSLDKIGKGLGINVTPKHGNPPELTVRRGQLTFNSEGNEGGRYHSRRPHVPSDESGVTIGRGYDMKERTAAEVYRDLKSAGLSDAQARKYSEGVRRKGADARQFITEHTPDKLREAARALGFKGAAADQYVEANILKEITLQQQKALFELTYAKVERAVKEAFPGYETYPKEAQEAVTDMAYTLGIRGLKEKFPAFVAAVSSQHWQTAAKESERTGASNTRNRAVKTMLEKAAKDRKPPDNAKK